jgi:hypothetical protein
MIPVNADMLNRGSDEVRYHAEITSAEQTYTLASSASGDNRWIIFDKAKDDKFYIVEGSASGGALTLNRVVFTKLSASCVLETKDLQLYANEVSLFYGDTSIARYGIKNSLSLVILTGIRDDFNAVNRDIVNIILLITVVVVIILGIFLGCKVYRNANKVLKDALSKYRPVTSSTILDKKGI